MSDTSPSFLAMAGLLCMTQIRRAARAQLPAERLTVAARNVDCPTNRASRGPRARSTVQPTRQATCCCAGSTPGSVHPVCAVGAVGKHLAICDDPDDRDVFDVCDDITQRVANRHNNLDAVQVEAVRLQPQAPTRLDGVARNTQLDARRTPDRWARTARRCS